VGLCSLKRQALGESHVGCFPRPFNYIRVLDKKERRSPVAKFLQQLWNDERGQDIAEYAVMLAVILVIVVGTVRLIGSNANNVFSEVGSSIQ
jgi:Flp pilus assembly pilin Flp